MLENAYLSMKIGPINFDDAKKSVMDALTEVQVSQSSGTQRSGFQFKLAYSLESEIGRELIPSGYFDAPMRTIFTLTMKGRTTVLMDGVITRQDISQSSEPGKSILTVTGTDLTQ